MRKVHLYGALAAQFGDCHEFEIETIREAIEALVANFPGFSAALRAGHFRVVVGREAETGLEMDAGMLAGFKLGRQDLHIIPAIEGESRGGLGKILAGVALLGLAAVTAGGVGAFMTMPLWGTTTMGSVVGSIGLGITLRGVSSLIGEQSTEDESSFTMSGLQSQTREGGIVPIAYGEVIATGAMISGALEIKTE